MFSNPHIKTRASARAWVPSNESKVRIWSPDLQSFVLSQESNVSLWFGVDSFTFDAHLLVGQNHTQTHHQEHAMGNPIMMSHDSGICVYLGP